MTGWWKMWESPLYDLTAKHVLSAIDLGRGAMEKTEAPTESKIKIIEEVCMAPRQGRPHSECQQHNHNSDC